MAAAPAGGSATIEPLRGEIYTLQHLIEHARTLGAEHAAASPGGPAAPVLQEFRRSRRELESAYAEIEAAVRAGGDPVPAEEWLLDNVHVVKDQLREITEDLPQGYLVKLPRLRESSWAGYPRVYVLARDFIAHTDSRLDAENLLQYILSYQEHAPLTIGELWAIPIMLRLGLVDNLRRLARQEVTARSERARADAWADRLVARARERSAYGVVVLAELATSTQLLTDGFVTQLLKRLREEDLPLGPALAWLDDRLAEMGRSAEEVTRQERHGQAANQVSVGNCITSMRLIAALDWNDLFERSSVVERILRDDPAGAYAAMDARSRDVYRHEVERLASRSRVAEAEVARRAVAHAAAVEAAMERRRHVGYFLIDAGRPLFEADLRYRQSVPERLRRFAVSHPLAVYLGLICLFVLLLLAAPIWWAVASEGAARAPWRLVLVLVLIAIPASEVAVTFVNVAIMTALRPRVLPKLWFESGVPARFRTIVAVPALLTGQAAVSKLLEDLEIRYLGNQDPHLVFALLADFPDGDRQEMPEDAALLAQARHGIEELNRRYMRGTDDHFHLLHRPRRWNPSQGAWMGWERKRGKLEEFNHVLRGAADTGFVHDVGDPAALYEVRYVITLDADTKLPRDAARRLVGTIAHPLNRPVLDPDSQRVVEGYGVVQPRVSATLTSSGRSFFARVFTGNTGLDPYTTAASDVYQDLFGEGSYYGKGIYDVDAFLASLAGRVPENRLLSHDLFEGMFVRVAFGSDIELLDDFPSSYSAYAARQHRWVRGDWQLAPWLLPRVPWGSGSRANNVPPLGRWKLLDNLRRSVLAPAILALLVAGLTFLPGSAWAWVGLALSAIVLPVFAHLATPLVRADAGAWTSYLRGHWGSLRSDLLQVGITVALLPEQALHNLDAITRTLARLLVTRRNLLEWETAAEAEQRAVAGRAAMWRSMFVGPALGAGVVALVALIQPGDLFLALPLGALWLASPFIGFWISQPLADQRRRPLPAEDQQLLRRTARKTWRFFEMFVTAEDNWLPPDNYQEDPKGVLARRTSPTNIGLYLLSVLTARDLGYITLTDLAERIDRTFGTLERLERYRGHLYNWYDTATGQPLQPAYVSTVDSGNFVGSLLTLAAGCREASKAPLVGMPLLDALEDTLGLLREGIAAAKQTDIHRALDELAAALAEARAEPPCCLPAWRSLALRLVPMLEEAAPSVLRVPESAVPSRAGRWAAGMDEAPYWASRMSRLLSSAARELDQLAPGLEHQASGCNGYLPSPSVLSESSEHARRLAECLERLAARATAMAEVTDFQLVYDARRYLFAIGFNVTTGQLDGSYYDLLASEARLASLVAIAFGQVPQTHWFRLGRQLAPADGGRALLSWSGTMFEYLMPLLIARNYEQTLLDETARAVVARHIEYARRRGVPWGISESAYNTMDLALNYQYHAFGVPGLGLKPGLADDLVISPYSTALALQVDAPAATRNLRALMREGMDGRFGFYEAIDYTQGRVPPGRRAVVVRAFMAHHQGMTLVALDNVLREGVMVRRFHADPRVRATELLLQERVPGTVDLIDVQPDGTEVSRLAPAPELGTTERIGHLDGPIPSTLLLSNGTYAVLVTASGSGRSTYRDLALTRWREDATLDVGGIACYVQDLATGATWSTGYQPTHAEPDEYHVVYTLEAARFRRRDGAIETVTEITVSPEAHAEVRRVTLTNLGADAVSLQLTSYAEVALAPHGADLAHPAFGNLFVETEFVSQPGALLCSRRPRAANEGRVWLAHVAAVDGRVANPVPEYETSRERFVGRGRDLTDPAALVSGSRLSNTVGAVLDPVLSLRRVVTLPPGERVVVSLCLAAADSRESALDLADMFSDPRAGTRTFELAWTDARVELRHLNLSADQVHRFQELAASLVFNDRERRAASDVIAANDQGQAGLWPHGISGDRPMLIVRVDDASATELVAELLLAHEYWRLNTLSVDLVLLNEDPAGYLQPLQDTLLGLVARSPAQSHLDQPGGVFVLRGSQLSESDRRLLLAAARVVLSTSGGRLGRQLARAPRPPDAQALR